MKLRKFKQYLSASLIAAMMLNGMSLPAFAQWDYEEGFGWRFYRESGEHSGEARSFQEWGSPRDGKWYGFAENERMYENQAFEAWISEEKAEQIRQGENGWKFGKDGYLVRYAFPDGRMARGEEWVVLHSDTYQLYNGEETRDNIGWYFFDKDGLGKEEADYERGLMVRDSVIKREDTFFAFDNSGKMIYRDWVAADPGEPLDEDPILDEEASEAENNIGKRYFQYDGFAAKNKWLLLDGTWYHFDDKGECLDDPVTASDSDAEALAPAQAVASVKIVGSETRVVDLGKTIDLKYKITLASDSDVKTEGWTNDHDVWIGFPTRGSVPHDISKNEDSMNKRVKTQNGEIVATIPYTAKYVGNEDVILYVDGVESEPFNVETRLPKTTDKKGANGALDAILKGQEDAFSGAADAKQATEQLKALCKPNSASTEEEQKEQKEMLKEAWLSKKDALAQLESSYSMTARTTNTKDIKDAVYDKFSGNVEEDEDAISIVGGSLNADEGGSVVLMVDVAADEPDLGAEYSRQVSFDISLLINNQEQPELDVPVIITMPIPSGIEADGMRLFNVHDGDIDEITNLEKNDGMVSFVTDRFSTYVFAQGKTEDQPSSSGSSGGSSGGSGGGGGSSSSGTSDTVTTDAKKGKVSSMKGIITGSGDGYSQWVADAPLAGQTESRWKLQYADGTFAMGSYVTDAQGQLVYDTAGNLIEQPLWELINGAWYAFGVDGYAKSGLLFDPALNGWFYVDINTGMKTGWQEINGQWYYFSMISNGTKGIMLVNQTTPDGYFVTADGTWDGQPAN